MFFTLSYRMYFAVYLTFLVTTCVALDLAADMNVTSERLVGYSYDRSNRRLALETTAIILWVLLFIADIADAIRYVPLILLLHYFVTVDIQNHLACHIIY